MQESHLTPRKGNRERHKQTSRPNRFLHVEYFFYVEKCLDSCCPREVNSFITTLWESPPLPGQGGKMEGRNDFTRQSNRWADTPLWDCLICWNPSAIKDDSDDAILGGMWEEWLHPFTALFGSSDLANVCHLQGRVHAASRAMGHVDSSLRTRNALTFTDSEMTVWNNCD